MALVLDEQQTMLRDSVRDFLAQEAPVTHLRHLRDSRHPHGMALPLWRKFGLMGFAGTLLSEAHGGSNLGFVEVGVIMEEIGRHLTPSPFWSTSVVGATALRLGGTPVQQQVYLPGIGMGQSIMALAVEERGKHDPEGVSLLARREGGDFVLEGAKTFVVNGHVADVLLVVARSEGSGSGRNDLTLFVVDRQAPGVQIERTSMVDSHNAARIRFESVRVPVEAALGPVGGAWAILTRALDAGRAAASAELVGLADAVFERTVAYLKERVQFGRRIGEFQALQHRVARLYSQIEVARAAAFKAAQALDAGLPRAPFLVAVAKAKAGSVATLAVQEAVQMHGGMGVTDELDIGLFMKRARTLEELLGDHRFHSRRVAEMNGY